MVLTITTTHRPATDLGFLLHKNPENAQEHELPFGKAYVFFPEASEERCTAAMALDVDPVGLVRGRGHGDGRTLAQYVNDRPYVASSYMSVAIAKLFRNALNGASKERQELADSPIPLEATVDVLSCRGGEPFLRRLFEPLGYEVVVQTYPLDPRFPEWGQSRYLSLKLSGTARLTDLLTHLYVLIPTMDAAKHYYIGDEEVKKLVSRGENWLPSHPEKEAIVRRFLRVGRRWFDPPSASSSKKSFPMRLGTWKTNRASLESGRSGFTNSGSARPIPPSSRAAPGAFWTLAAAKAGCSSC
jgi:3' terminal RNA ribose 2'-O-methyltransferase Hen1